MTGKVKQQQEIHLKGQLGSNERQSRKSIDFIYFKRLLWYMAGGLGLGELKDARCGILNQV